MSATLRSVRRRSFIVGSVAGGITVATASRAAFASPGATGQTADVSGGLGTVVAPSNSGESAAITLSVDGRTVDATPEGFPEDWEFIAGDLVFVDLDRLVAMPYVGTSFTGDTFNWVALNEDTQLQRTIASIGPDDLSSAG